jgi:hypothetical protein
MLSVLQPFLFTHFRQDGWEDEPGFRVRNVESMALFSPDDREDHKKELETTRARRPRGTMRPSSTSAAASRRWWMTSWHRVTATSRSSISPRPPLKSPSIAWAHCRARWHGWLVTCLMSSFPWRPTTCGTFHFLTGDEQRQRYVEQVLRALKPGGHAIVGAFGPEGPEKCSGLPAARYGPDALHASFGAPFELVDSSIEVHQTPWGTPQQFAYCFCKRHDHDQQMHKLHEVVRRGQ